MLAIAALVGALAPGWSEAVSYNQDNNYWITQNYQPAADASQGAEVTSLLDLAADQGGGRVYAGMPSNWGYGFTVGSVQVYIYMMKFPAIDAVGFTFRGFGLMTNPEAYFDEYNPGDYRTFGVRYLLLPVKKAPMVPATLDTTAGRYALWTVKGVSGVFQVVDTIWPAISVTRGCDGQADDPCENTLGPQSAASSTGRSRCRGSTVRSPTTAAPPRPRRSLPGSRGGPRARSCPARTISSTAGPRRRSSRTVRQSCC